MSATPESSEALMDNLGLLLAPIIDICVMTHHISDRNAEYGNVPGSYKSRPSRSPVPQSRVMYVVALLLASTFALCGLAIPLVQELSSWIPSTSERVLMSPSLSTHSPRFQERSYFPSQCASGSAWSPPSYVE